MRENITLKALSETDGSPIEYANLFIGRPSFYSSTNVNALYNS
jgi:hypothetical protein